MITGRVDLHDQLSATFVACGLPNPVDADSIDKLQKTIVPGVSGRTVLSTIFKFHWEDERLKSSVHAHRLAALRELEVEGSENWILMVDECHRTQEKDLGAYLQAILPKAVRFGFTGTPVKKNDLDTFNNFGAKGERYLDKYGIDDAVADGATVRILYQGRMTEWHLHDKELATATAARSSEDAREVSTGLDRAEGDARAVGERAPGGVASPSPRSRGERREFTRSATQDGKLASTRAFYRATGRTSYGRRGPGSSPELMRTQRASSIATSSPKQASHPQEAPSTRNAAALPNSGLSCEGRLLLIVPELPYVPQSGPKFSSPSLPSYEPARSLV